MVISREQLATDALALLDESQDSAATREAGLLLVAAALRLASPATSDRTRLVVAFARAVRERFRWAGDRTELAHAIFILERTVAGETRDSERGALLSELVVTLMRWWLDNDQIELGRRSEGEVVELTAEERIRRADHDRLRSAEIARAAAFARRAVKLANDSASLARAHHAAGLVNVRSGQQSVAIGELRSSVALAPNDLEIRLDLAYLLCDGPDVGNRTQGLADLRAFAARTLESRPRLAFEANRYRAFVASQTGDTAEECGALEAAVDARERARDVDTDDADQRRWVRDTFRIHAWAAAAHVRRGDLSAAVDILENGAAREFNERLGPSRPPSPPESDEVLIYTTVTDGGCIALLVIGDRIDAVPWAFDRSQLRQRVESFIYAYTLRQIRDAAGSPRDWMLEIEQTISWLRDGGVDAISAALPAAIRTVTIIPDGTIGLLPLHAAFALAIPDATVRYAPSSALIDRRRRTEWPANALAIVEPLVPDAAPLPSAGYESDAVGALFADITRLQGDQARLRSVDNALANHGLIHIAAHGENRADVPEASAVILAEGDRLAVPMIMAHTSLSARLVVLSACESAMHDASVPEERIGLPLAFLQGGAAGVVASSWAVGDLSTAVLMGRFYEDWSRSRDPIAALAKAQRWIRMATRVELRDWLESTDSLAALAPRLGSGPDAARPFAHPLYWAAFAYYGG